MSVDSNFYIVYGLKFDSDVLDGDDLSKLEKNNIDYVNDWMMGKYVVLGEILHYCGEGDETEFNELIFDNLEQLKKDYLEKFKEVLPDHYWLVDRDWKLFSFINYN
jgi:hypothetical protein